MGTRGEGRAPAEKSQRVITPAEIRRTQREARQREEAEWAARSGPVTVQKSLYHYTCSHAAAAIDATGTVLPLAFLTDKRPLPWMASVAWFTDLAAPDRYGLGLTSFMLRCDRTERRYRVIDPTEVVPYTRYARALTAEQRDLIESAPGARPAHWYVAVRAVPVVADPREGR